MSAALSYLGAALLAFCALVVSMFALGALVGGALVALILAREAPAWLLEIWAYLGNKAALARMAHDAKPEGNPRWPFTRAW